MDRRLPEAEAELRRAIELECRDASLLTALAWTLIGLDRLDEALPIAERAYAKAGEDLEVYCVYCGLMARHGRGARGRRAPRLPRADARPDEDGGTARTGRDGLAEKFEFAISGMSRRDSHGREPPRPGLRVLAIDRGLLIHPSRE